jgi:O-antigen/teichoic acid export membrane protein
MRISHVAWSLAGLALPLFAAFATIPEILRQLGAERFGLLALAWALVSYAGIFELGIGRSATQLIAQLRGRDELQSIRRVVTISLRLSMAAGAMSCVAISLIAATGVQGALKYDPALSGEVTLSIWLLALTIPIQVISATYRGVSEAFQQFRAISVLRMLVGTLNFVGPYLMSQNDAALHLQIATLLGTRIVALFFFRHFAIRSLPAASEQQTGQQSTVKRLFRFAGWVTVSSIISPVLVQADRFVIGTILSASAVTIYVLPYELVSQTLIVVSAVSSVAFPSLTQLLHKGEEFKATFRRWLLVITITMVVICLVLALLLPYILEIWLGSGFDPKSVVVGRILCIGVVANSIGVMFYALLHAKGRADLTAKIHIAELPIFLLALIWLTAEHGLNGAAVAWSGRMVLDTCLLALVRNTPTRY